MAKNPYSDLTTLQLADVYFTTKNSYGKVEGDLLEEVNKRGGENSFQEQIETEKKLTKEKARIREEVFSLMSDHQDSSLMKKLISSQLLSETELNAYIDHVHKHLAAKKVNRTIDAQTISGSVIGVSIAVVIGGLFCGIQVLASGKFYYLSLVLIYGISWLIIKLITKKDASNAAVLISAIIATILAPVITFILLDVSFK